MYGFLLDRASLSWASGEKWRTSDGEPFVIFTLEEIRARFGCAKPKAIGLLKALEAHNLIQKDRPKKDGPFHIRVKKIDLCRAETVTCTVKEMLPAQVRKADLNNTDNNYIDVNQTDRITLLESEIRSHIEYHILLSEIPKDQLDAIVTVMAQVLACPDKTITVGGIATDSAVVKDCLRKAGPIRIQYIFDHMQEMKTPILSYRSYYLARLCEPEGVVDAFYDTLHKACFSEYVM